MSASEEIDPSLGTPQSEKLIKALTARIKGSQTPAPMADIPKEDGSPKPDTSLSGEDIDDHFIPTILREMGGHLSDAHVKCIAVTLFTIGITDMEELLEIDQQALTDVCRIDDDLSYMHHIRTRKFLCHLGSPNFKVTGGEASILPAQKTTVRRNSTLFNPSIQNPSNVVLGDRLS